MQIFESYSLLPPIRDLKELRSFAVHQADLARFRARLNELCAASIASQLYRPIADLAEKALEASSRLSEFPAEEFEALMASKPEMAEGFLANVSEWEAARNFSADVVDERSATRTGQVTLLVTQVDPLTHRPSQRLFRFSLLRADGRHWKVTGLQDLGPPRRSR